MKRKTKQVMLNLDQELYYKIKAVADDNHVPVATYIKLLLAQLKED